MSANKNRAMSGAVAGVLLAIALTAVMCGVYALLIKNGKITNEYADILISAAIAVSVLISVLISKAGQGRGGLFGLSIGLIYSAVVIAVPLLAYPTEVDWLKIIRIIAVSAAGGMIGGIINLGKSNKSFHKKRKK